MSEKVSETRLNEIFVAVGQKHGYKSVYAEYMAFKDFKVSWQHNWVFIDLKVSDYCAYLPEGAVIQLANHIFDGLAGGEKKTYPEELRNALNDDSFSEQNQNTYLRRTPGYHGVITGYTHNLEIVLARLTDKTGNDGAPLLPSLPKNLLISWAKIPKNGIGVGSSLMRTVLLNDVLNSSLVPDYAVEYALFVKLVPAIVGMTEFKGEQDKLIARYPEGERDKAVAWYSENTY